MLQTPDFAVHFRTAPCAFLLIGTDLILLDANEACLHATRRRAGELVDRHTSDAVPLMDRRSTHEAGFDHHRAKPLARRSSRRCGRSPSRVRNSKARCGPALRSRRGRRDPYRVSGSGVAAPHVAREPAGFAAPLTAPAIACSPGTEAFTC